MTDQMTDQIELKSSYDVIVIGGGPAGTAAATFLQRQGHSCLVLEASRFPRYHVGESLIPHTYGTLDRLGLLPKLRESDFPVKQSVRFVHPSGRSADPFYFSETIEGDRAKTWQVERSEFDAMCAAHAAACGVQIAMGTRVHEVLFDRGRATGVAVRRNGSEPKRVAARVVVDASGRATVIGNQLGLKDSIPSLRKSSIWSYYRGAYRQPGIDAGETTIFMIEDRGWFWYIPLPDDMVSVGIVASPEYLWHAPADIKDIFQREVDRAAPLAEWLRSGECVAPVRGIRELAYLNRETVGPGWVMVGDAAGFLDPIYSSGIFLALASAELAAECIDRGLRRNDLSPETLGAFTEPLWEGVDVIWRLIRAFYEPQFSFRRFVERYPEHRAALIDCLVGDVVGKDMASFLGALATMTPPPEPLRKKAATAR